ncbi:hypothetical protein [Paenibacillus koleovorans]|uniref:hypothetical protein n=1 Tax=Paenibacillus koleovorans TaxID=121608 RepID=UPI000FD99382|nr:hypothetical protein [Paenibacillus koleovorans]
MRKRWLLPLAFGLIWAVAACGNVETGSTSTMTEHRHMPQIDVQVQVNGTSATVKVSTDMHISPEQYGKARKEGEGHIHMYLDNGEKIGVTQEAKVFENLTPGVHTIRVSLHNNDHTPYDVTKSVEFTIAPPK